MIQHTRFEVQVPCAWYASVSCAGFDFFIQPVITDPARELHCVKVRFFEWNFWAFSSTSHKFDEACSWSVVQGLATKEVEELPSSICMHKIIIMTMSNNPERSEPPSYPHWWSSTRIFQRQMEGQREGRITERQESHASTGGQASGRRVEVSSPSSSQFIMMRNDGDLPSSTSSSGELGSQTTRRIRGQHGLGVVLPRRRATSFLDEEYPASDGTSLTLFARPPSVPPPPPLLLLLLHEQGVLFDGDNDPSSSDYYCGGRRQNHHQIHQMVVDRRDHSSLFECIGIIERALSIVDLRLLVDEEVEEDDNCSWHMSSSSSDDDYLEQDDGNNHDHHCWSSE